MKFGMKVQKDIAEDLPASFSGSRARSARNCAQSAHSELCEHCYLARSAMKIGLKVYKYISDHLPLLFFRSRARSASICTRSVHSELCKHCYLARGEGGRLARNEGGG